jgi:hypothetical protein
MSAAVGNVGSEQAPALDVARRREQLASLSTELQWDLGGLLYEMAIRDHIRIEILVQRAAALQEVNAELSELERMVKMQETGAAGLCPSCQAPHSSGAAYCWQCGQPLLKHVPSDAIGV